jgi:hypothetical protein
MSWDIVAAYLAACMTIAWLVMHLVFFPALGLAQELLVDNEFTRNPNLAVVTHFVLNTLIAPLFLVLLVIPGTWAAYVSGTERVLLEPREIQS